MSGIIDITGRKVLDFIQNEIKKNDNVDNILKPRSLDDVAEQPVNENDIIQRSKRGFVYERLWDICIKFGVVDELTLKPINKKMQTTHVFGNTNIDAINFEDENIWNKNFNSDGDSTFLSEPIQSGNSGGYSDITFLNKVFGEETETLYLISVKYFEKEKDISHYDIGKLCALVKKHTRTNRDIKMLLFVKSKTDTVKIFKDANKSSDVLIKYISPGGNYENVYDVDDLQRHFVKLRILLKQYNFLEEKDNRLEFKKYLGVLKSIFTPRFHQELFIKKINQLLNREHKNILVGAIPRSGKSFIMAGAILDFVQKNPDKKSHFLIITPAPTETYPEYEAIFNNYNDFDKFNIKCTNLGRKNQKIDRESNNVLIVSKQKLGWNNSDKSQNVDVELQNINKTFDIKPPLKLDLVFLDEAHFGMTTNTAKNILHEINKLCDVKHKIFVTATYKKPLDVYNINKDEAKLTWDINDINIMKKIDTIKDSENEIKKRFGDIYTETIKNYNKTELKKLYSFFPEPYLITSVWDYKYLNREKMKIGDTDYGFDMEKLFTVKKSSDNEYTDEFSNHESVVNILRYYFGYPDKKQDYENQHIVRHRGILPRIKRICENRCRTMQIKNKPTTQLWFLPYGQQRPIKNVVNALLQIINGGDNQFKYIKENYYFFVALDEKILQKKYDNVEYYNKSSKKSIKDQIMELENDIKMGERDGTPIKQNNLIILAGARLQLGISLNNVDIVTLWNNVSSTDAIFQMLFRSMTEENNKECLKGEYCDNKKFGFMVDLNPQRALTNVFMFKDNLVDKETRNIDNQYKVIGDLINIDEDVFIDKYDGNESKKAEYVKDLFNKLYDSWGNSVDSMKKLTTKILKFDQQILNTISSDLTGIEVSRDRGDNLDLDKPEGFEPGKKTEKQGTANKGAKKTKKKQKKVELSSFAAEVISEYLSLLNIFTLYNEDREMKCIISKDIQNIEKLEFTRNKLHEIVFSNESLKTTFMTILNTRLGRTDKNKFTEIFLNKLLSAITSNENKLSINKLIKTQKKKYYEYTIENPGALLEFINKNLTPKEKERKELGEVFTPMWLVNEMLDKLPKEVWSRKDYKWLDPAVGIGNYPIAVYLRLMEGLEYEFPNDEEKKRKWILENMLFMIDVNEKNVHILKKIFCAHKYNINVYKGSFFGKNKNGTNDYTSYGNWDDLFKVKKFDVIMGNPPYNEGGTGRTTGSRQPFWPKFIDSSLPIINENGFLLFIHPKGWRKPCRMGEKNENIGRFLELFLLNGFLYYINISDKNIPNFPPVDYYVFIKKKNTDKELTICDSELNNVKITSKLKINHFLNQLDKNNTNSTNFFFLPSLISENILNIIINLLKKRNNNLNFKIEYRGAINPNKEKLRTNDKLGVPFAFFYDRYNKKYEKFYDNDKYKEIHSLDKTDYIKKPKIVMTFNGSNPEGKVYAQYFKEDIGVTTYTMYQLVESKELINNIKSIMNFLNSDLIYFFMLLTQYSPPPRNKNDWKLLNMIQIPNLPKNCNEDDIYKYFDISSSEIKLIKKVISRHIDNKKTKKLGVKATNNVSMKNNINNTNHNGGGIRSKKHVKRSKKNN